MNRALWIAKKNLLCNLIKKVSDFYGGDDIEFLREYCRDVLAKYYDETIDVAITCFTELCDELKWIKNVQRIAHV